MRFVGIVLMVFLVGCSNLNSPRFSKGFYEEKRLQLTRKAELIKNDKTRLVAFATYMSDLDVKAYPNGEVFLVEVAFEDKSIKLADLSFSLLGRKPLKIQKVSQKVQKEQKLFSHSPWNQLLLVYFDPVLSIETTDIVLEMRIKNQKEVLRFDYSYIVENII